MVQVNDVDKLNNLKLLVRLHHDYEMDERSLKDMYVQEKPTSARIISRLLSPIKVPPTLRCIQESERHKSN